jgi:putative sigma-54 modulation protein
MTLNVSGKNYDVKRSTRAYIERKLKKIRRLAHHVESIHVTLEQVGHDYAVDFRVHADHAEFIGKHEGSYVRSSIDRAIEKLERQLVRYHGKKQSKRRRTSDEVAQPGLVEA